MTREELKAHCKRQIEQFERIEKIMPVTPNDWKRYEEHKLVLELLEQEPCEDAVSREEAVKVLRADPSFVCTGDKAQAITDILSLPSVTPQPKIAHWIHFANSDDCSGCGWSTGKYISPSDYCPKCGARMIEPAENMEVDSDEPAN